MNFVYVAKVEIGRLLEVGMYYEILGQTHKTHSETIIINFAIISEAFEAFVIHQ